MRGDGGLEIAHSERISPRSSACPDRERANHDIVIRYLTRGSFVLYVAFPFASTANR
jgi:hypothetical protein